MLRTRLKLVALSLIAALALGVSAEAAGKKTVRHRPKHSSRVTSGATTSTTTTAKSKRTKKRASKSRKSTSTKKRVSKPTTKPR